MLLMVATLVLLNQLIVQPALLRIMTDAPVINIAGRQRMLSQRLAKAAFAMEAARDDAERCARHDEVAQVLKRWTSAHESLRGDPHHSPTPKLSDPVNQSLEALETPYQKLRDAAFRLLQHPSDRQTCLATILGSESEYLERMDGVVGLLEREASARVDRLWQTGWAVTVLILIGLVLMGSLSLRPAVGLIRRQILELDEGRQALERKVQARTRALEHESRERARAEEHQRMLVEQFSLVARTTTIGEMATGLAHELNQPLGAIANYAEGCLVLTEKAGVRFDDIREALDKILATSLRAGEIVGRIRRFVTRHEAVREKVEANRLVAEVQDFFHADAERRGIALKVDLASQLPLVWGDPVQIQQVLVNLVRNALESLSNSQPPLATVVIQTRWNEREGLVVAVRDNGEGISPERLEKVFDSFFSTRDEGMGMGLAISRTIIEAHQGRIEVESVPWVRTSFRFVIPPGGDDDAGPSGLYR